MLMALKPETNLFLLQNLCNKKTPIEFNKKTFCDECDVSASCAL